MKVQTIVRQTIKENCLDNKIRDSDGSYSIFYSQMTKKFHIYKRALYRMDMNAVLLNKEVAIKICNILNK